MYTLSEEQKNKFSSLKVEIIDINILAHFFIRKINRTGYLFQKTTRHHMYEEFVALRYMENGLILHLTNLDDDNSNYSFRSIVKDVNKVIKDHGKIKIINKLIKNYRQDVNKIKVSHRNKRIAHLNYEDDLRLDQFLDFEKEIYTLIKSANSIGDYLWGEKIDYGFELGRYEGVLEFRKLTENLKVDISGEKGF